MVGLLALYYVGLTLFNSMYSTSDKSFYSQNDRQSHENPKNIDCDVWYGRHISCKDLLTRYLYVVAKLLPFGIAFATGGLKTAKKQVYDHRFITMGV